MSTSLKARIRTAAAAYPGLAALLGTAPFRWYDNTLIQGSALPAVVVQVISGSPTYVVTGRLHTGWSRIQFSIWGSGSNSSNATDVETQLLAFLDQLNLIGIPGLAQYPCQVVLQRDLLYPKTQPPLFLRQLDAMIFSNDSLP